MHPFYSLYAAEMWQADRLREAEVARRNAQFIRATRAPRQPLREALGYKLVEVGLRLAVREPAAGASR
jgi:hypothetical protein